jgi:uncharacterized damage-inducible protein DinB
VHPSVVPLAAVLRLNTQLLLNCLAGMADADARRQPGEQGNHFAFIVAHLVDTRHFIANLLGAPLPNPLEPLLANARKLADVPELPPLGTLEAAWEAVSAHLAVVIERLDTAQLAQVSRAFPGSDGTLLGNLAFLVQHDSYHIGQLGLLRRQLGYPSMSYAIKPREPGRRGA